MGVTQFVSVPYALYAKNAGNTWSLHGNSGTTWNTDFIGTTDVNPFTMRVNGILSVWLDPLKIWEIRFSDTKE